MKTLRPPGFHLIHEEIQMQRGFICILGEDRPRQLYEITNFLSQVAKDAGDVLNVIVDGGHSLGPAMTLGLLVETKTASGLRSVRAAVESELTDCVPCFQGSKVVFINIPNGTNRVPVRHMPGFVVHISLSASNQPKLLRDLADYFSTTGLMVITHRGRHLNDDSYLADFVLVHKKNEFAVENWSRIVNELKEKGFNLGLFRIEFNPDFVIPPPGPENDFAPIGG